MFNSKPIVENITETALSDSMEFSKYHGSGNDFVLINNMDKRVEKFLKDTGLNLNEFVRRICAPHFGIGADGLILIEKPEDPSNHFKWQFFNPDGSLGEMCGNGARCAIRFAYDRKIVEEGCQTVRFETLVGVIKGQILQGGKSVRIQLTKPSIIREVLAVRVGEIKFEGTYLEVGVPHFVVEVEDLEGFDVLRFGREIRYHETFGPRGTNVNFVKPMSEGTIMVRTYERGVENETFSCGTGVVASAIACRLKGKIKEKEVKVKTRSGEVLKVFFGDNDKIFLEGSVVKVFDGILSNEVFGL